jgi:hypothetical protein
MTAGRPSSAHHVQTIFTAESSAGASGPTRDSPSGPVAYDGIVDHFRLAGVPSLPSHPSADNVYLFSGDTMELSEHDWKSDVNTSTSKRSSSGARHESVVDALYDPAFCTSLYAALTAWGLHRMGPGNA